MNYVYIIKSRKTNKIYVGCTNDLRKRLNEHNRNRVKSTCNSGPWEVRYYEAFYSKNDAFSREKGLKRHARGIIELKKRLVESLI
jgi:putative endonuclease